jgi:hypothetical protein
LRLYSGSERSGGIFLRKCIASRGNETPFRLSELIREEVKEVQTTHCGHQSGNNEKKEVGEKMTVIPGPKPQLTKDK